MVTEAHKPFTQKFLSIQLIHSVVRIAIVLELLRRERDKKRGGESAALI